ncbi:MAG: CoA transferase [Chloroflexi bacterium]|nr:CoA transferase [Chloroflexota bacterium]
MGSLPLEGIRVADFGQIVAVPFCAQMLGWMGAEVILIESHVRSVSRGNPPFAYDREGPNTAGPFNTLNTNKLSCTLNLTNPQGVALAREIIRVSDVVVDNFATGTMEKLGLGYQEVRKLRPDSIVASLGAFGRRGPYSRYGGLHSAVAFFSGVAALTSYGPADRPRIMGAILPDPLSGTFACLAILEALEHRERTGQGQYIDLSMSEVMTQLIPEAVFDYSVNGREGKALGNRDPVKAPHGIFRCRGRDAWVAISVSTDGEWQGLCRVIGRPDLADDPRFADPLERWQRQAALEPVITAWTRKHAHDEAMHLLQDAGVPAGASLNAKDLLNDPHLKARGFITTTEHPEAGRRRMGGLAWKTTDLPRTTYRHAPLIGEHTGWALGELLGLPREALARLEAEGVTY